MKSNAWVTGGNEVQGYHNSKPCLETAGYGGLSARIWDMNKSLVKSFQYKEDAEKRRDYLNKYDV